jgi:hypothetical protein
MYRAVSNGAYSSVIMGENNSNSFREVTSLGKYITVASAVTKVAKTAATAINASEETSAATTQALSTDATTRHAATTAADVTKATFVPE